MKKEVSGSFCINPVYVGIIILYFDSVSDFSTLNIGLKVIAYSDWTLKA